VAKGLGVIPLGSPQRGAK